MSRKPASARDAALGALSRREHSRRELARKLSGKGYAQEDIAPALDELQEERLLSDARFVEMFVHGRRARGYGPVRIRHELQERGVAEDLVAAALDSRDPAWLELAREARRKRFGAALPADRREWAKQAQFLTYRGFNGEQVRAALRAEED